MIYIVARWETAQMANELEWRYWRQIRGAFFPSPADVQFIFVPVSAELASITAHQFATMEQALDSLPDVPRVFLEPRGTRTLDDIPSGDVALICGNTEHSNDHLAKPSEMVRVRTPGRSVLYAHNAVAVALAHRYGQ